MRLLKSYFNAFVSHKILKTKRIANRYRKLSANKVFVGKGELKHTNSKVVMTSYIYNAEQLYLKSLLRKEARNLYYPKKELERDVDNPDKKYLNKNINVLINARLVWRNLCRPKIRDIDI